jgi:hypothetical protein
MAPLAVDPTAFPTMAPAAAPPAAPRMAPFPGRFMLAHPERAVPPSVSTAMAVVMDRVVRIIFVVPGLLVEMLAARA